MKTMIAAAAFTGLVSAHSWVHCTDYRGDTTHFEADKCFGNPRPLDGKVPGMTPFGQDTGFNQQPGSTLCHSTESTHASYPMATYQRGQQITLAWPTKNHVAADCTNSFIPDTALELFVAPFTTTTETNYEWSQVSASFSEDPHVNGQMDFKGFQNCPDFCNNMDKALCTGTFILPDSFADGLYTFQWRWEFNAGSPSYITCFEAEVKGDFDGTIITPTPRPTVAGQTAEPTAQPENCGAEWSQCGGAGPSYSCCNSGLTCFRKDNWYSQCRSSCPENDGWECEDTTTGPAPTAQPTAGTSPVDPCHTKDNGAICGETCCAKREECTFLASADQCVTGVSPTEPPTEEPSTGGECVSDKVQFLGAPRKQKANDATHCYKKCLANKTKKNKKCLGWEWVEGDAKPCRLYTSASTSIAGLRDCHPTEGLQA